MKKFFVKVQLPIAAAVAIGSMGFVTAADWPEHLTLHEESRSPDGHYGIVVTTSSHVDDGATVLLPEEGEEFVDYFADLQTHRSLGRLRSNRVTWRRMYIHNFTSSLGRRFAFTPRPAIIPNSLKVPRPITPCFRASSIQFQKNGRHPRPERLPRKRMSFYKARPRLLAVSKLTLSLQTRLKSSRMPRSHLLTKRNRFFDPMNPNSNIWMN